MSINHRNANDFNYSQLLQRIDTVYAPADLTAIRSLAFSAEHVANNERDALTSAIVAIWSGMNAPDSGIAPMAGVLIGLFDHLETADGPNATNLAAATEPNLIEFITTNPKTGKSTRRTNATEADMHLRRNVVNGALLALTTMRIIALRAPLIVSQLAATERNNARGKHNNNALPQKSRREYDQRVHVRPATHDETVITRLASRLFHTKSSHFLCAATVALATSTAATAEIPAVLWCNRQGTTVQLPGYARANGHRTAEIDARTADLDEWANRSLDLWREECEIKNPVLGDQGSITYSGRQAPTSDSAKITADNQIRNATTLAGLDKIEGLTANSFRLWAATVNATDPAGALDAATKAGLQVMTLHRNIRQLGDRA